MSFLFNHWKTLHLEEINDLDLYVTHGDQCHRIRFSEPSVPEEILELKCDHEEADARLLLHSKHAPKNQFMSVRMYI